MRWSCIVYERLRSKHIETYPSHSHVSFRNDGQLPYTPLNSPLLISWRTTAVAQVKSSVEYGLLFCSSSSKPVEAKQQLDRSIGRKGRRTRYQFIMSDHFFPWSKNCSAYLLAQPLLQIPYVQGMGLAVPRSTGQIRISIRTTVSDSWETTWAAATRWLLNLSVQRAGEFGKSMCRNCVLPNNILLTTTLCGTGDYMELLCLELLLT